MKKTLLLTLSILFICSCFALTVSAQEKYPEIILNVPFYSQNYKNSGDCGISSVAMIEAYKKGYSQNDSTVYNAVFKHNNYKVALSSYAHIGYSRVSNSLEIVYEQLSHGNPVIIFRSSPHYSVVYGYNGTTDKLEKEGFLVLNTFRIDGKTSVGPESSNNFGYSNMKDWLNGYEWQDTIIRTGNAIPLEDKTQGNGMFNEVWMSNYTETNAQINAKIPYQWITEAGFYIGTSKDNLTKHVEKLNGGTNADSIWYDLNKWGVTLKKDTTYYYRFYFVKDGVTYNSNTYSFPEAITNTPERFNNVWVSNLGKTNAQINASINLQSITEAGFYIGTSKDNLTKHVEKLNGGTNVDSIWYDLNKWGVTLEEGTTYYYQIYYIKNGTIYKSDVRTFTTTGCTHMPQNNFTKATCTKEGEIVSICLKCGDVLLESTIPATGHSFDNGVITINPTTTNTGIKIYTCEICKETKEEIIPTIKEEIHKHTQGSWVVEKEADCIATGKKVLKCSECSEVLDTEIIAKLNHSFDNGVIIKEATNKEIGKKLYTCINCNYAKVEDIPINDEIAVIESPFTDVPKTQWYYSTIITVYQNKLMMGNSLTTFNPSGTMTLAEAITIASRIHCKNTTNEDLNVLGGENWYDAYVNYAIENGIIRDTDFSNYSKSATRGEMAYIFSRCVTSDHLVEINSNIIIPDVYDDYKYAKEITTLYKSGVVAGSDEIGRYYPERNISRAEVAMIVARLTNLVNRVKK